MPDMLVKLYGLPPLSPALESLEVAGIIVRTARAYEKHLVLDWVTRHFSSGWASECDPQFLLGFGWESLQPSNSADRQERDVACGDSVVPCGERMSQFVEYDAAKNCQHHHYGAGHGGQAAARRENAESDQRRQQQKTPMDKDADTGKLSDSP